MYSGFERVSGPGVYPLAALSIALPDVLRKDNLFTSNEANLTRR